MATFGDLKQQASRRLQDVNNTAVSASDVGNAINAALDFWKQERFWFNQASQSVVLTIGNPVIPIVAANILYILPRYGMRLAYQSYTYDLAKIDPVIYDAQNIQKRGRPYGYTWLGGQYLSYYYPDQAYTVSVNYIRDYTDLVNDADTNDFTQYADQLILYDAMSRLTAELITDPTISAYYETRCDKEWKNLSTRTNKMIGTGKMQSDGNLLTDYNYYYYN